MGLEEVVVGVGETEVLHPPGGEAGQRPRHQPLELQGQPRVDLDQRVERAAEEVLRHHPGAAAGGDEHLLGDALARELRGDVDGAVPDADDQHPLAVEVERVARADVVVGVERLAVEAAGEVGEARVPVVAVADDQEVELLGRAVAERDPPAAAVLAARRARPGSRSGFGRAARTRRRSGAGSPGSGSGAGSPGTRPGPSACRGTRRRRARCRCGATGRPRSARSGCRSTSCRRCRRSPRSRCRGCPSRRAPCRRSGR